MAIATHAARHDADIVCGDRAVLSKANCIENWKDLPVQMGWNSQGRYMLRIGEPTHISGDGGDFLCREAMPTNEGVGVGLPGPSLHRLLSIIP